jgi:hypothetical protein
MSYNLAHWTARIGLRAGIVTVDPGLGDAALPACLIVPTTMWS